MDASLGRANEPGLKPHEPKLKPSERQLTASRTLDCGFPTESEECHRVRILLVEDDVALADAVCGYLLAKAFVVDVAPSLADARGALLCRSRR